MDEKESHIVLCVPKKMRLPTGINVGTGVNLAIVKDTQDVLLLGGGGTKLPK